MQQLRGKNTSPVEATVGHNDQRQQLPLRPVVLAEIVNDAVKKVKENKVFKADLRDELKHYEYGQLPETSLHYTTVTCSSKIAQRLHVAQ